MRYLSITRLPYLIKFNALHFPFLIRRVLARIISLYVKVSLFLPYLSQNCLSYLWDYTYGILSDLSSYSRERDGLCRLLNMKRSSPAFHYFKLVDCTYAILSVFIQSVLSLDYYHEGHSIDYVTKVCFVEDNDKSLPF